eukprot:scaffold287720_cov30-Tisochrysis_lutea.AAC.1
MGLEGGYSEADGELQLSQRDCRAAPPAPPLEPRGPWMEPIHHSAQLWLLLPSPARGREMAGMEGKTEGCGRVQPVRLVYSTQPAPAQRAAR